MFDLIVGSTRNVSSWLMKTCVLLFGGGKV